MDRRWLPHRVDFDLQVDTNGVIANPFGLYVCQLNASGAIFQKSYFLEEKGSDIFVANLILAIADVRQSTIV